MRSSSLVRYVQTIGELNMKRTKLEIVRCILDGKINNSNNRQNLQDRINVHYAKNESEGFKQ